MYLIPDRAKGSFITLLLLLLMYVMSLHLMKPWKTSIIGGGDTWGYYLYLPSLFIHHDLDNLRSTAETRTVYYEWAAKYLDNPLGNEKVVRNGKSYQLNKYTVGVAVLQLPSFLVAHALAKAGLATPDGYSPLYIYVLHLGIIFYVWLGLLLLRRILLRYFSDLATALTLAGVALATNLYYFTISNGLMAHAYLFFLYCLLIWFTVSWYSRARVGAAVGIGVCAGLITLIRPVEIIALLIPLLWGLTSTQAVAVRWAFLRANWKAVAIAAVAFALMSVPQLLYWKFITGKFIYYSYGEEGFNFSDPELLRGIFGYKNGWLAYTPIMYLAIFGILFYSRRKEFFAPVLAFLPLHLYIIYSWWCWNYINGFGSRPMVEAYALLALPMGAFIQGMLGRTSRMAVLVAVIAFCSWLNIQQTFQLWKGRLWSEDSSFAFYLASFGKTYLDYPALVSYDTGTFQPDEEDLELDHVAYKLSLPDSTNMEGLVPAGPDNRLALLMGNGREFGPTFSSDLQSANLHPNQWLRLSATCLRTYHGIDLYQTTMLVCEIWENGESLKREGIRIDNKINNTDHNLWGGTPDTWGEAYFWIRIPKKATGNATIKVYPWNPSAEKQVYVSHMQISAYRRK